MRIRSTKPEFWRSTRIASVSWDARLVLKGLESYVDDNGVGKDDIELIVGDVFPRDLSREGSRVLQKVSEAISHLNQAGLVWRYEGGGTALLYLAWWDSVQRIDKPTKGRFPRPDGTMNYRDSEIRGALASIPEVLAPGTGEQGNRGTGEQGRTTLPTAAASGALVDPWLFTEFWKHYPRKVGKDDARKAWNLAVRKGNPDDIVAGADRYARDPNLPDENYIPYPAKWLRGGHWSDGALPARTDSRPSRPTTDHILQGVADRVARSREHRPEIES